MVDEADWFSPSGRGIKQFMWAYQPHFRIFAAVALKRALEVIGFDGNPEVILVGFRVKGSGTYDICVEPEDGPFGQADLSDVLDSAKLIFDRHPDQNVFYSNPRLNAERVEQLKDSCRAEALADALASLEAGAGRVFFCSPSVQVGDFEVHVVSSVDASALAVIPQIKTRRADRVDLAQSLVHAVLREINLRAVRSLYLPEPGRLHGTIQAEPFEVARRATALLLYSAMICAGQRLGQGGESHFSSVSTMPYEKRWGSGNLVLARLGHPDLDVQLTLQDPVALSDVHALRKLMEASGGVDLLSDGEVVYGFGFVKEENYDPSSESIFVVSIKERGTWELTHAGNPLVVVRDGQGYLPPQMLNTAVFRDSVSRILPDANVRSIETLAEAIAEGNEHGAMLIISSDAEGEAKRLHPQAMVFSPAQVPPGVLCSLTRIDGGVLLDSQGRCHAAGVILDGNANGRGDSTRGSRFNSAIRYLASDAPPAVVVVYSTDESINVLPSLIPRIEKSRVEYIVDSYLSLERNALPAEMLALIGGQRDAGGHALRHARSFIDAGKLWDMLMDIEFYLSEEQCNALNAAKERIELLEKQTGASIHIVRHDLHPSPEMNDSYWK